MDHRLFADRFVADPTPNGQLTSSFKNRTTPYTFQQAIARCSFLVGCGFCLSTGALAQTQPTDDIKPLLAAAMRDGVATAEISGPVAGYFKQVFKRNRPVIANARSGKALKVAGCKVITITFSMPGETIKDARGDDRPIGATTNINYCVDGSMLSPEQL